MNHTLPDHERIAAVAPRRRLLASFGALLGVGAAAGLPSGLTACSGGSGAATPSTSPAATPTSTSVATASLPTTAASDLPTLGANDISFARHNISVPGLAVALSTAAEGSSLLACVGRGNVDAHAAPTDSKGNAFRQIGSSRTYTNWSRSGTALYFCGNVAGGNRHVIAASKPALDETTLSVVEVRGGGKLQDVRWKEVLAGSPLTSDHVVTTGPALLVAWWWGDAGVDNDKTAVPDNGFTVIHSVLHSGELVQCAVAARRVDAAGSYSVTWTSTPLQGAQLWIAAVQPG